MLGLSAFQGGPLQANPAPPPQLPTLQRGLWEDTVEQSNLLVLHEDWATLGSPINGGQSQPSQTTPPAQAKHPTM